MSEAISCTALFTGSSIGGPALYGEDNADCPAGFSLEGDNADCPCIFSIPLFQCRSRQMNKNTIAPKKRAATGTPTPTPILTALFEPEDGGAEEDGEAEDEAGDEGDEMGVVDGGRSDEATDEATDEAAEEEATEETLDALVVDEIARTPIVVYADARPRIITVSLLRQVQAPQQYKSPPQGVI